MAKANIQKYIGLTEAKAVVAIQKVGMLARITQRDDKSFIGTCDFRINRVNLVIKEGKVVEANIG